MKRIILILLTFQLLGADAKEWKVAVLTEVHKAQGSSDEHVYTFDLSDRIVSCTDPPVRMRFHAVDIGVGSEVRYSRSKDTFVVLDRRGKEQKLIVQQEVLKPTTH